MFWHFVTSSLFENFCWYFDYEIYISMFGMWIALKYGQRRHNVFIYQGNYFQMTNKMPKTLFIINIQVFECIRRWFIMWFTLCVRKSSPTKWICVWLAQKNFRRFQHLSKVSMSNALKHQLERRKIILCLFHVNKHQDSEVNIFAGKEKNAHKLNEL